MMTRICRIEGFGGVEPWRAVVAALEALEQRHKDAQEQRHRTMICLNQMWIFEDVAKTGLT